MSNKNGGKNRRGKKWPNQKWDWAYKCSTLLETWRPQDSRSKGIMKKFNFFEQLLIKKTLFFLKYRHCNIFCLLPTWTRASRLSVKKQHIISCLLDLTGVPVVSYSFPSVTAWQAYQHRTVMHPSQESASKHCPQQWSCWNSSNWHSQWANSNTTDAACILTPFVCKTTLAALEEVVSAANFAPVEWCEYQKIPSSLPKDELHIAHIIAPQMLPPAPPLSILWWLDLILPQWLQPIAQKEFSITDSSSWYKEFSTSHRLSLIYLSFFNINNWSEQWWASSDAVTEWWPNNRQLCSIKMVSLFLLRCTSSLTYWSVRMNCLWRRG
jgi:hypothetical protein